jgi:1-deoxy-D-xylulose-5-phosphate reductoisomerase
VKRIIVLGSTGSIGESTLEVLRAMPESFRLVGLACGRRVERIAAQAREFHPEAVAVSEEAALIPADLRKGRLFTGPQAAFTMVQEIDADLVVNGIGGASGLLPSLAAIRSGKDLALANKESMVMAGPFLLAEAATRGRRILPVDSEHAALFSLLSRLHAAEVAELILTASGGAFRSLPASDLAKVRFADALRHPTWKMGAKITVDSEISTPDMCTPIQNALTYPCLKKGAVDWLDLAGGCLSFFPVDPDRCRMLGLAYEAACASAAHPIVFNAANELAVEWFMKDVLSFAAIPDVVEDALALEWSEPCDTIEGVLSVDGETRRRVNKRMKGRIE